MDELRMHLSGPTSRMFQPAELNEIILTVYNILERAVKDGSDTLHLTPARFVWSRDDTVVGNFRIDRIKPTMSFREALQRILARDPLVRRHMQLVTETPEELTYRLQDVPVAHAA